ncbi:MAG: response regulator [Acidobacteriota bacterium]
MAKILIADDSTVCLHVSAQMVRRLGHQALLTNNGHDALRLLIENEAGIQLALMDWRMAGMDGLEATQRFRRFESQRQDLARVPVLAMTASVMVRDRQRLLEGGMDDVLGKPITLQALKQALDAWLLPGSVGSRSREQFHDFGSESPT